MRKGAPFLVTLIEFRRVQSAPANRCVTKIDIVTLYDGRRDVVGVKVRVST